MEINWIAVIVAALVPMILGYIWYVPLFGKQWQASLNFTDEDVKSGNMGLIYGLSLVMALILAIALGPIIEGLHAHSAEGSFHTFKHGMLHGAMISFFVSIPVLVSNSLFQKNSLKNILINAAYWMLTMAIMGGIIDAWQ